MTSRRNWTGSTLHRLRDLTRTGHLYLQGQGQSQGQNFKKDMTGKHSSRMGTAHFGPWTPGGSPISGVTCPGGLYTGVRCITVMMTWDPL